MLYSPSLEHISVNSQMPPPHTNGGHNMVPMGVHSTHPNDAGPSNALLLSPLQQRNSTSMAGWGVESAAAHSTTSPDSAKRALLPR